MRAHMKFFWHKSPNGPLVTPSARFFVHKSLAKSGCLLYNGLIIYFEEGTMKVWKLLSPKIFAEEERPDAIASPTQAKVKITKVLLGYPEVRAYTGAAGVRYPLVPGMYAVGIVAETGSDCVKVEKNTRVFLNGISPCGECAECRRGNFTGCLFPKVAGMGRDGFLRDFVVAEEGSLTPLPPSVTDITALYAGILSHCDNIVNKLDVPKGTHVAVLGAGESGNILSQLLIYRQAVPILIDKDEERLAVAAKCGVYYTLKADDDLIGELNEITGGRMAEGCVYTSFNGISPELPFRITAARGKVVFAGMEFPELSVHLKAALDKRLTLTGVSNDSIQSAAAINLLVNKAVELSPLLAAEQPAEAIASLFAAKAEVLERDGRVSASVLDLM